MCYPRIFGYVFNPITVYYCLENNKISAMIYEVNNTFGEDHIYVVLKLMTIIPQNIIAGRNFMFRHLYQWMRNILLRQISLVMNLR